MNDQIAVLQGRKLAIVGAGGHGGVVAEAAALSGKWEEIDFFDDNIPSGPGKFCWNIVGTLEKLCSSTDEYCACVVAIGDNATRLEICRQLLDNGFSLATVVHPSAIISPHSVIGAGTVVFSGAIVNIGAFIERACIINNAATVNHDSILAAGVHVAPNAAVGGNVQIGEASWIGIGASVRQGICIGRNVVVGAGAAVVANVANGKTVVGVPARER